MDSGQRRFDRSKDQRASFLVRILYRRNASWQGEIQWMEGQSTQRFRSALELVALMQEAMDQLDREELVQDLRHWHDDDEHPRRKGQSSTS